MKKSKFIELAKDIENEIVGYRRHIHSEPELAFQELKTSNFIEKILISFGIEDVKKIKDTGVVAIITGENPGKCLALRADIDALPLDEKNNLEYASKVKGIAHMCGHDVHTAILLGVAKILQENKNLIKGSIKLIFQPAEEGGRGAKYMIENKVLESPKPDGIMALHCWPDGIAGDVYYKSGSMGASSDRFKITISGKQCHGAYPQRGVDPIVISSSVISAIQNIVSREIAPTESAVLTVGTIHGGSAANVIPESVVMEGTIRTFNDEMRSFIHKRLEEVCKGVVSSLRGQCDVEINVGQPPLENNAELIEIIKNNGLKLFGKEKVFEIMTPTMGAEDFSFYSKEIPGALFRLGCGFKEGENSPLHSVDFVVNEECIVPGIALVLENSVTFLEN
ncbi:MAG: M20 metallopeptidase family protein [Fusobacteriaceae bacterium]